jgi:hypothetical protein
VQQKICRIEDDKFGQTKVGDATNVLTNESRDLTGGKAGELEQAKMAEGHAIANALTSPKVPSMAPTTLSQEAANSVGRPQDERVMRQVYVDRIGGRPDPAGGRQYFGNSPDKLTSRRVGNGRQTVFKSFGPFDHGHGQKQYVYIYNDPPRK